MINGLYSSSYFSPEPQLRLAIDKIRCIPLMDTIFAMRVQIGISKHHYSYDVKVQQKNASTEDAYAVRES